jgi:hypothetical protein
MSSAKLSGALLVWKGPPLARIERDFLAAEEESDKSAAPDDTAAEAPAKAGPRPATVLWLLASGAAVIALGGAIGLALPTPVDGTTTAPPPLLSLAIPRAAADLTPTAVAPALQAPKLQPAVIALPQHGGGAASPAATARTAVSVPADPANPALPRAATVVEPTLRARGDALFVAGHLDAARVFYERAAEVGDGRAALQLGETYDPAFLAQTGLVGERGNTATAARWYRRAAQLGASDADMLLRAVMAEPGG